jgi:hypothetical protein
MHAAVTVAQQSPSHLPKQQHLPVPAAVTQTTAAVPSLLLTAGLHLLLLLLALGHPQQLPTTLTTSAVAGALRLHAQHSKPQPAQLHAQHLFLHAQLAVRQPQAQLNPLLALQPQLHAQLFLWQSLHACAEICAGQT